MIPPIIIIYMIAIVIITQLRFFTITFQRNRTFTLIIEIIVNNLLMINILIKEHITDLMFIQMI